MFKFQPIIVRSNPMNYPSIGTCAKCGSYPQLHRTQIDRAQGRKVRVAWVQDDIESGVRLRYVAPNSVIKSSERALPSPAFPHESAWGKYPNIPPPDNIWTEMAFDYVNVCPKCNPTPERQSTIHQANNQWNSEQDRKEQPDHWSTEPMNTPNDEPSIIAQYSEQVFDAFISRCGQRVEELREVTAKSNGQLSDDYRKSLTTHIQLLEAVQRAGWFAFSTILEIAMRDIGATKPVDPPAAKDPEPAAPSPYRDTKLRYYEFAFPLMPSKEMWEMGIGVQNGMTLHDWFAGQALAGRLMSEPTHPFDLIAKSCQDVADAMMAERARRANVT